MSLLLLEGFDDGLSEEYWTFNGATVATYNARRLQSVLISGNGAYIHRNLTATEEDDLLTVGCWMLLGNLPSTPISSTGFIDFRSDAGTRLHANIIITQSGQIAARRAGTVLGTSDIVYLVAGESHYVEVQARLHDTAGLIKVWVDGVVVLDLTGIDTKNGGTKTVFDAVRIANPWTAVKISPEVDDIYITNEQGAAPWNGNLGNIVVDTLFPNDNGQYSDFAGSDGNSVDNHLLVDEAPSHDSDTTYVESGTDTDRESYDFDDLFYATGAIRGVIATAVVRNTGTADNLQVSARIGAIDYDGATQAAPANYNADIREVWQVSPATATDWTIAEINAAEFGIENVV